MSIVRLTSSPTSRRKRVIPKSVRRGSPGIRRRRRAACDPARTSLQTKRDGGEPHRPRDAVQHQRALDRDEALPFEDEAAAEPGVRRIARCRGTARSAGSGRAWCCRVERIGVDPQVERPGLALRSKAIVPRTRVNRPRTYEMSKCDTRDGPPCARVDREVAGSRGAPGNAKASAAAAQTWRQGWRMAGGSGAGGTGARVGDDAAMPGGDRIRNYRMTAARIRDTMTIPCVPAHATTRLIEVEAARRAPVLVRQLRKHAAHAGRQCSICSASSAAPPERPPAARVELRLPRCSKALALATTVQRTTRFTTGAAPATAGS